MMMQFTSYNTGIDINQALQLKAAAGTIMILARAFKASGGCKIRI